MYICSDYVPGSLHIIILGDTIRDVSSNVRLGFGSFNDKPIQPFTSTPIEADDPVDASSYAFRHSVDFTDDSAFYAVSISLLIIL